MRYFWIDEESFLSRFSLENWPILTADCKNLTKMVDDHFEQKKNIYGPFLFGKNVFFDGRFLFLLTKNCFSFMFTTPFLELKTMVVSDVFFSLRKRLQLYVFYSIFRAEDDGPISLLFLFRKKAQALCFLLHFSSWRRWSCQISFSL